jgi:hypothetical protein
MKKMILVATAFMAFAGCTKEVNAPAEETQVIPATTVVNNEERPQTVNATIEWSGDPALDGLGWVIHTSDGAVEVPDNLSEEFKQDQMAVVVSYQRTDKRVPCRCAEPKYYVHILSIERGRKE